MTTTSFVFGFGCGFVVAWGIAWLIAAIVWTRDRRESARWERLESPSTPKGSNHV